MFNKKPKHGSTRTNRRTRREFYRLITVARKAGKFDCVADMPLLTTRMAVLIAKRSRSSRNFKAYHSRIRAEQRFNDAILYCNDY